jgi:hypothetical protein
MKIRLVEAELFHAEERTDGRDEVNSRFSQFCEKRQKKTKQCTLHRVTVALFNVNSRTQHTSTTHVKNFIFF